MVAARKGLLSVGQDQDEEVDGVRFYGMLNCAPKTLNTRLAFTKFGLVAPPPISSETHRQFCGFAHTSYIRQHAVSVALKSPSHARPLLRCAATQPLVASDAPGHSSSSPVIGFPFKEQFEFDGQHLDSARVIEMLTPFMFEERIKRIEQVAARRTYSVLPIVEGLYDMGNLAAVCRSADAMGFGAVHCINKSDQEYKQSVRTSAGSEKWLDVGVWDSTRECLTTVKAAGYQIIVTHLSKSSIMIQEVDWTRPTAFVLGNERAGVTEEAVALADHCAIIPMTGFVESFNISVAAALIMYEAQQQRLRRLQKPTDLTEDQQRQLQAALMLRSVKESSSLIKQLLSRPPRPWQASKFKTKRLP